MGPHRLRRFEIAQDGGGTYATAVAELRAGRKVSHWMWFVFPQIAGLGRSATAKTYSIVSLDEAKAYVTHPVLGPRLTECAGILAELTGVTARDIFGEIDAKKLHSSMTLFALAAPDNLVFQSVLNRYFGGMEDEGTLRRV